MTAAVAAVFAVVAVASPSAPALWVVLKLAESLRVLVVLREVSGRLEVATWSAVGAVAEGHSGDSYYIELEDNGNKGDTDMSVLCFEETMSNNVRVRGRSVRCVWLLL